MAAYRLWHIKIDQQFLRDFAAFNERCKAREAALRQPLRLRRVDEG
jgi:hypothetical protein